ncbi:MAG: hypothetical protein P4L70_06010 [Parasulfuritortus sp.]|jgi:hypothetical protein|nr:hypothetical protein [Parasulfuritortus sp.]
MQSDEKQLLRFFRGLSEANRKSLLDYAEFLASRKIGVAAGPVSQIPLGIERPVQESVIKAVKRLRLNYPMLEYDKLLNEATALVSRHVMHKDPAPEVIDELELVFKRHYDAHLQTIGNATPENEEPV